LVSVSWINEGAPQVARRNGLAAQLWLVNKFPFGKFGLCIWFGVYAFLDRKHPTNNGGGYNEAQRLAGIISPSLGYKITDEWVGRFTWNRIVSDYNRDSDVFMLGAGYCF
jgi:hypothetical protein